MGAVTIEIPPERAELVRYHVEVSFESPGETLTRLPLMSDVASDERRRQVREAVEKVGRLATAMDQIGWDDAEGGRTVTMEATDAEEVFQRALDYDLDDMREDASRAELPTYMERVAWLTRTLDSIERMAVVA